MTKKSLLLAGISVLSLPAMLAGCASASYNVPSWDEKVDSTRTQLFVHNYEGGYGSEWLKNAKTEYERLHAEDSYEEGKKGVQIMIKADKNSFDASTIKVSSYDLYFLQESKAYSLYLNGALEDITAAVTGNNPYEPGVTLESKLSQAQKDFFQEDGKYFGINHYIGSWGLSYNKTIFDQNGFYFVKGYEGKEGDLKFVKSYEGNPAKSVGRDGIAGTDDDGLPVTYEDFYELCDFIASYTYTPFTFSSKQKDTYVTSFLNSLFVDALGAEGAENLYKFENGQTMDNLVKINVTKDKNGVITSAEAVKDSNGNYVYDSVTFNGSNGYEIYRSEKYLRALEFMYNILCTKDPTNQSAPKYFSPEILKGSTYDYQAAQRSMVQSSSTTAMIIEGQWWENEAKPIAEKYGTSYDFGWMPLPRYSSSMTHKTVYNDTMDCITVVKKGTSKKDLALDFIQFVDSNQNLVKFTQTTNAVKGLEYDLTDSDLASCTNFGKTVARFKQNSDLVFAQTKSNEFIKNLYASNPFGRYASRVGSTTETFPITAFMKNYTSGGVNAEQYFLGTYINYANTWSV